MLKYIEYTKMEELMSKEKISKYLLSSCNKNLKKKLENFLFEEKEEKFTRGELSKLKFYNYYLYSQLDIFNKNRTIKKSEDNKILKRLYSLGYEYYPEKLISELSEFLPRLSFYKELKFDEEFIIQDLIYGIKNSDEEDQVEVLINEFDKKFTKILDTYILKDLEEKDNYLVMTILKKRILKKEEDKIQILNNYILKNLAKNFSTERVENILKYDLDAEYLIEVIKDNKDYNYDKKLIKFIKNIYEELENDSEEYRIIEKLIEILYFPQKLEEKKLIQADEYFKFVINSNLPLIYKLVYLHQSSEKMDIIPYLKNFIKDNKIQCKNLLERMCIENIELGNIILQTLLNCDVLSSEEKNIYIKKYEEKLLSLIENIESKKDEELEVRILNTLGYMLVFSDVEKYIERVYNFYLNKRRDTNEFINIISHFEKLVEEKNEKNPWLILSDVTSIDKRFLIVGTIDFVMIKSSEKFTEFLKLNEDILYDVLSKKIFDRSTLDEILHYSYESDINFDSSKLLPYLTHSDEKVIEKLFKVLNDKEEECSYELEKLLNGKNKKNLKNAEKLKKIWESNNGRNFKSVMELEEYCKNILQNQKRDIPYFKDDIYKRVREKNKENFLNEDIIKYYVSLYISNDFIEESKLGEVISEYFNKEDLRECVGRLFELWIDNRAPLEYINIVKLLSYVGDEFWIDKILSQCELLLKKGKNKLVINILYLMLSTEKKSIYTIFEYIQTGLQHDKINEFLRSEDVRYSKLDEKLDVIFKDIFDFSLGFDNNGEKILNYGKRKLKLKLNEKLEISIYNHENKEMKSLPKFSQKFDDNEEKVEFYQREYKKFKKKREFILKEIERYFFYQMIGNKTWTLEEWREEINNNFVLKVVSKNIIWLSENKEENSVNFCKLNKEDKFIDIHSKNEVSSIKNIKLFYLGDFENIEIKKETGLFFNQLEIEYSLNKDINEFENIELNENRIVDLMRNYYIEFFDGSLLGKDDKLVMLDKFNKVFFEINMKEAGAKNYIIKSFNFYNELNENVEMNKINKRFLNFVLYALSYMKN